MPAFDGELVNFEDASDGKLLGVIWRYLNTHFLFGFHSKTGKFVCLDQWKPEGGSPVFAPPPVFLAMRGMALERFTAEKTRREKLEKETEEAIKNAPPNPFAELDEILGINQPTPKPLARPNQTELFPEERQGGAQTKEPLRRFGGRRNSRKLRKEPLPQVKLTRDSAAPSHHELRVAHQAKLS